MSHRLHPDATLDALNARMPGSLPGWCGVVLTALAPGRLSATMPIRAEMLAPNGFLHAASVIALADTAAGFAALAHLPEGADNFTTVDLSSNFLGTQTEGELRCEVRAVHTGKTTQVWDAEVIGETGRTLAVFRCTQMILWPRAG